MEAAAAAGRSTGLGRARGEPTVFDSCLISDFLRGIVGLCGNYVLVHRTVPYLWMKRNQNPAPSCPHSPQPVCPIRHEGLQSRWWGNERACTIHYEPGTVQYTTAILPVRGPCASIIIACRNPLHTRSTSDHVTPSQSRVLNPKPFPHSQKKKRGKRTPLSPLPFSPPGEKHRVGSIWFGKSVRLRKGHPANK